MWKPIHLHVEVQGRVFVLRRRGDGWEDVGAALPPRAWGEIEGDVRRAVRGRQVLSGLATLVLMVGVMGFVGVVAPGDGAAQGPTPDGRGWLGAVVLALLGAQFLRMAIRNPIHVACDLPELRHWATEANDRRAIELWEQSEAVLAAVRDQCFFVGGASAEEIAATEASLGVRFPKSFIRFLSRFGAGSVGGHEIYGVLPYGNVAGVPSVVFATLVERNGGLPQSYVVVSSDGCGGLYLIDGTRHDAESPVFHWVRGTPIERIEAEYESFGSMVAQIVEQSLGAGPAIE